MLVRHQKPFPAAGRGFAFHALLPSARACADLRSGHSRADAELPNAFGSPTTPTSERSVSPEGNQPEPRGGARAGHALPIVLPGQGAGPPEVVARSQRLVVSAADREGEAGA